MDPADMIAAVTAELTLRGVTVEQSEYMGFMACAQDGARVVWSVDPIYSRRPGSAMTPSGDLKLTTPFLPVKGRRSTRIWSAWHAADTLQKMLVRQRRLDARRAAEQEEEERLQAAFEEALRGALLPVWMRVGRGRMGPSTAEILLPVDRLRVVIDALGAAGIVLKGPAE